MLEVDITFCGKDYSPVSDTTYQINNTVLDSISSIISNDSFRLKLLVHLLRQIDPSSILVNHSYYDSKKRTNENYNLFTENFSKNGEEKYRYDGIVGTISKRVEINLIEDNLIDSKEIEDYENEAGFSFEWLLNARFDILSRFDEEKPYFLATMLIRDGLKFSDGLIYSGVEELCDHFLVSVFKNHLTNALIKGFFRSYKNIHSLSEKVRGSIDTNRLLEIAMDDDSIMIPCKFRERSQNNNLNRLIVETYLYLRKKYPRTIQLNFDSSKSLHDAIETLWYITSPYKGNIINDNLKPITHPYFSEYEELRQVCLRILTGSKMSLWNDSVDANEEIQGVLFYIPDLWELYLEDKLKKRTRKTSISFKAQGGRGGISVLDTNNEYIFKTYPDFVFYEGNNPITILDAKFIPAWDRVAYGESDNNTSGLLDDYTKCIRDMISIKSNTAGVIYPTKRQEPCKQVTHSISRYNDRDIFFVYPISIPEVNSELDSYNKWVERLNNSIDTTFDLLLSGLV